jgi:hypothetical protein
MKPIVTLDFHDLTFGRKGLAEIKELKEHYPNLKVTFFTVPIPNALTEKRVTVEDYHNWADWLRAQDWIEICPHGMTHAPAEMLYMPTKRKKLVDYQTALDYLKVAEHTFAELDLPYQKIWASPFWQTSPDVYQALWDQGYIVAVDPNQEIPTGGPVYTYNWSIDTPFPSGSTLVKGHGHMFLPSTNAVELCLEQLLEMPADANFKFVSELAKEQLDA